MRWTSSSSIRPHVLLCWLALLLVRVIETTTGTTWHQLRDHLDELHIGTFTGPAGTYRQRTELAKPQRDLFAKLGLTAPQKSVELAQDLKEREAQRDLERARDAARAHADLVSVWLGWRYTALLLPSVKRGLRTTRPDRGCIERGDAAIRGDRWVEHVLAGHPATSTWPRLCRRSSTCWTPSYEVGVYCRGGGSYGGVDPDQYLLSQI